MTHRPETISAVLITRNNAETLERALLSLTWVDELIVLDRGSTDGTLALARHFTPHVFYHPSNNLTLLRHDALSRATADWILWVEPDEWVEVMLQQEIESVLPHSANINGYRIPRLETFQQQWLSTPVGFEEACPVRLVRKGEWDVAENWTAAIRVSGKLNTLEHPLGADPYGTIDALFTAINTQSTTSAYETLDKDGASQTASVWPLIWHTKRALVRQLIFRGALWKGAARLTVAVARIYAVFLKQAKIATFARK